MKKTKSPPDPLSGPGLSQPAPAEPIEGVAPDLQAQARRIAELEKEVARLKRDGRRLDRLEESGGFVRGTADGLPAVRILGTDEWLPSLRAAIDAVLGKRRDEEEEDDDVE